MEVIKPNDIFVATLNNPNSTTFDFMSAELTPENTSLFSKEEYMGSKFVQDKFRTPDGVFDKEAFEQAFNKAASHYQEMTDERFLSSLGEAVYSPFDITRPLDAKLFSPSVEFGIDYNPFKQLYSRKGINSVSDNPLSPREIAQQNKVFDVETGQWTEKSANDLGILRKFFGDTLVYAQWDEDGEHIDMESGRKVKHSKGEWKLDEGGNLYLETLGKREVYGKQIVSPMDLLTTDGSLANSFDFLDSDSREKSVLKTTAKMVFEIAPFLIPVPGVAQIYGGLKAAVSLASILPTFYKAFEGLLLGDTNTNLTGAATAAEGYMSKFTTRSFSDKGTTSPFNYEQLSQMVGDVFSQIYEQRAAASLATLLKKPSMRKLSDKGEEIVQRVDQELAGKLMEGKLSIDEAIALKRKALENLPEYASVMNAQSKLAKSLSLSYMSLLQSADVYSEALAGGYDRRTAGFAALSAATGQYAILANNRMGDWFLDKTTGYSTNVNKALIRKSTLPFLKEIQEGFKELPKDMVAGKAKLAAAFHKMRQAVHTTFNSPTILGEAMLKNAIVEGVEEVTEQAVMDATKGIIDTMSALGLIQSEGSFGGFKNVFSRQGLETYLVNFLGGLVGGGLFEFQRAKIEPWIHHKMPADTKEDIYDLIANGHKEEVIKIIREQKNSWGNSFIGPVKDDGTFETAEAGGLTTADILEGRAIDMVNFIDGLLNSQDLGHSDEEVVKKVLRDDALLKMLRADKLASGTGLEGLILEEFKSYRTKILHLTGKITALSTNAEANAETIDRLTKERQQYKDTVMDLLEGNQAERFFGEGTWYLLKSASSDFVAIDKESFVEAKYNTSYNNLPDDGDIAISKKRIDKEFADYLASKDLRKYLDVGYRAYLNLEKKFNPELGVWEQSGYKDEFKKTLNNFLDLAHTSELFDTSVNPENKIENFIHNAVLLEKTSGKRVMPWESIKSKMAKSIIDAGLFEVEEGLISSNGKEFDKKELAEQLLSQAIANLPPEQVSFDAVENMFASLVQAQNGMIAEAFKEELEALENELAQLDPNDPDLEEKSQEIAEKKESYALKARVIPYTETEEFKANFETSLLAIQEHMRSKGLTDEILSRFSRYGMLVETLPEIEEDFSTEDLAKSAAAVEAPEYIMEEFYDAIDVFKAQIEASDLTTQEKADALSGKPITGHEELAPIFEEFNTIATNAKSLIATEVQRFNREAAVFNEYFKEVENQKKDLLDNRPNFFKISNILISSLLSELQNNNLDGELMLKAKKLISDYLRSLQKLAPDFPMSDTQIIEISQLSSTQLNRLLEVINNLGTGLLSLDTHSEVFDEMVEEVSAEAVREFAEPIPSSIQQILDRLTTLDTEGVTKFAYNLEQLETLVKAIISDKENLETIYRLNETVAHEDSFKQNSVYNFLRKFELSLERDNTIVTDKLWTLLEGEEAKLLESSSVDAYFASGTKIKDLEEGIKSIKMLQGVVMGASSTTLDYGDPIGFLTSRQNFVKRNNLESEITELVSISSDSAELIWKDLERVKIKLQFLKDLSRYNSSLMEREQGIIETRVQSLLLKNWEVLLQQPLSYKNKAIIPNLEEILNSGLSDAQKLFKIENDFYENLKEFSEDEKLEIGQILAAKFPFKNQTDSLYSSDGSDELTRDIQRISNKDMVLYLLATMSLKSSDFAIRLNNALKTTFDKAPFFTQELGVKIMYASSLSPKLFGEVMKTFSPIEGNVENGEQSTYDTSAITYILGNAGTGKTTVMLKLYTTLLLQTNEHLDIWISGPELKHANKLKESALNGIENGKYTAEYFSKATLFEKFGLKDIWDKWRQNDPTTLGENESNEVFYRNNQSLLLPKDPLTFTLPTNLPEIVMIDEITHFTALEQFLLSEAVKRAELDNGKIIKIFAAGDPYQLGVDYGGINYNIDRTSGLFLPSLFLTVRAENNQQRDNTDLLFTLTKRTGQMWRDDVTSTSPLFNGLLKDGISLSYYKTTDTLNGALITENVVPLETLLTIAESIRKNPAQKLGILTDPDGTISEDLKAKLESSGIPTDNYELVSPKQVQGQEFEYFIFNLSQAKQKHVFDSLKGLYTYVSRAKKGAVIVRDDKFTFLGNQLLLSNKQDFYSDPIPPLDIQALKDAKSEELTKLLGSVNTIESNLVFNRRAEVGNLNVNEISMSTDSSIDTEDPLADITVDTEDPVLKFSLTQAQKIESGSQNVMVHTFYNDMNVISAQSGETVTIVPSPSKFSYGLTYLLDQAGRNKLTLTKEAYDEAVQFLVSTKYDILANKKISVEAVRKIFADNSLTLSDVLNSTQSGFVITADRYYESANKPIALVYDDPSKHLKDRDKYINLMYRIVNPKTSKEYMIHLGTFPNIKNLEEVVKTVFKDFPIEQKVLETYKGLLENLDIGEQMPLEDPNSILSITSTRLWSEKANKEDRKRTSLRELMKTPGLMFYDASNKVVDTPVIRFFPSTYEDYRELFLSTLYGKNYSEWSKAEKSNFEEKLRASFEQRRSRPYVTVSFTKDSAPNVEKYGRTTRFITLHSKTRSWKDIEKIIIGDAETGTLSWRITQAKRIAADNPAIGTPRVNKIYAQAGSLFSGNDVLDLLVSIASEKPELYDRLLADGNKWVETILADTKESSKELRIKLFGFGSISSTTTVLDAITYHSGPAKEVYRAINEYIKKHPKPSNREEMPTYKANLKNAILRDHIKDNKAKFWFQSFWNIFKLQHILTMRVGEERLGSDLDKQYLEVINDVVSYWKSLKSEIYVNIPIKPKTATLNLGDLSDDSILDLLYTTVAPEGPRILVNLKDKVKVSGAESVNEKLVWLETEDPIGDNEAYPLAVSLKLKVRANEAPPSIKLKIAHSNKSIEEVKEALELLRSQNAELAEILKLQKELKSIKHNKKPIIAPDSSDKSRPLSVTQDKVIKATLIKELLKQDKWKNRLQDLLDMSIDNLKIASKPQDGHRTALEWAAEIKSMNFMGAVKNLQDRILLILTEGKSTVNNAPSNELINELLILLNFLDDKKYSLLDDVFKAYEPEDLNEFVSAIISLDPYYEPFDNLKLINEC